MRPILAIARQTFSEGVRMRFVLVSIIVLAVVLLRLPFAARGDETLTGRLQTFLAYSFGALGLFTSLATIVFSCATLASEIRNCEIHLIVTKPVARWQVLAGKWLGVNLLNVVLVVLCAAAIYLFAVYVLTRQERFGRDRIAVRDTVWTARASARPVAEDLRGPVMAFVDSEIELGRIARDARPRIEQVIDRFYRNAYEDVTDDREWDPDTARAVEKLRELVVRWRALRPGEDRVYLFENLPRPASPDTAMQVRFRARANPMPDDQLVPLFWTLLDPESGAPLTWPPIQTTGRTGDLIQFLFRGQAGVHGGKVALALMNYAPDGLVPPHEVVLEGEDWLQIMYRVGSFEGNFLRNTGMLLARLAFLSAVGLLFGVFVSFPVACLCAAATYLVGAGWNWWFEAIGADMEVYAVSADPYGRLGPYVRLILVPLMRLFPNFGAYNGTSRLIAGELIPVPLLLTALGHTLLFGIGLLIVGAFIFERREIAEVTL